jgi:hypothetical protein
MPRFKTLSDAINNAIDVKVPIINFPDGSITNLQIGRTPLNQNYNYSYASKDFVWGVSTWGLQSISTKYKPD